MSKIICEVCGTSYPDTTVQCPICGCVRPGDAQSVSGTAKDGNDGGYTYVKGGRFSKANVRKHGKAAGVQAKAAVSNESEDKNANRGLVITAIVLLLAIVAVASFIVVKLLVPGNTGNEQTVPSTTLPSQTTEATEPPTIPCKSLKLETDVITLDKRDAAWMIYVKTNPADTTDEIEFSSSDEKVATVTAKGKVVAVSPGEAIITVTCGEQSVQCKVECVFELPTEETTVPEETEPDEEFQLNRKDITFSRQGDTWMLYSGSLTLSKIKWTSDNEAVATIEGGKVTAVGGGQTTVHGEYNGEKVSCIIRCAFTTAPDTGVSGNGGVSEDGGNASADGTYQLKNLVGGGTDEVTISIGYSFGMSLVDSNGNAVDGVVWTCADTSVCTVSGGTISGVGTGMTTVTATYNGQTYTCTIRVS